ncbi:MAG: glycosyltransferase [Weeksellaceae bacterium]
MRILIVDRGSIPALLYGGTERVIWGLGLELVKMGHQVTYLVHRNSHCDFAQIIPIDEHRGIVEQIKGDFDIVHFHFQPDNLESLRLPYVITMHGNLNTQEALDRNTIFVSKNHAARFQSEVFVHNGLHWEEYPAPDWYLRRNYFHFLGNAAWRVKNVKGAIDVIKAAKTEKLRVLGGVRFNFNMGIRFTFSSKVRFEGMVGCDKKTGLLNASKGLIFPVRWHEPFGLAIIESLYYGAPVFGTPYGSLPELITAEVGFLSNQKSELTEAVLNVAQYSKIDCHDFARENFNSRIMAEHYLNKYERVLNGEFLNVNPPILKEIQTQKFLEWN